MPRELELKTALFRHPAFQIQLWKDYATSTAEQQHAHRQRYMNMFQKVKTGKVIATVRTVLNDYKVCHVNYCILIATHPCIEASTGELKSFV